VLQLQIDAEGLNETDIHGYTTVSFVEGEGSPNLWVAYHVMKQAGPRKSVIHIIISPWIIDDLCYVKIFFTLCQEFKFQVGVTFELTLTTEPMWKTNL
jgi:hypothetical protein